MAAVRTFAVSYTNVETVHEALPEIKTQALNITSAEIAREAGQVEALINAKIARFYALPFAYDVPLLTGIATDLTCYNLLVKRLFTAGVPEGSPWPDRWKEAMEILDSVAAGETPLLTASLAVIAGSTETAEAWSLTQDYSPTYYESDETTDFEIDPDRTEDAQADRA